MACGVPRQPRPRTGGAVSTLTTVLFIVLLVVLIVFIVQRL